MLKLMWLDWRKMRLKGLLRTILSANGIIILWLIAFKAGHPDGFNSYEDLFKEIAFYTRTVVVIFASLLTARVVLDEYRTRTITILFVYPVSRTNLLISKLALVSVMTFVTMVCSHLLVAVVVVSTYLYNSSISQAMVLEMVTHEALNVIIFAFAAVGMGFVLFFIGMIRKSAAAMLVSSCLMTMSSSEMFSQSVHDNVWKAVLLSGAWLAAGGVLALLAIKNAERAEV
ncbi:ABC transporter permease [Paenibacillus sp. 481]|uniref:ABC transporter permease n=1 Tax=Paenibacillus sp. 481 TaxID=2835869 RepID=UPI001E4523B0|nr:ABC transporter permease [Paenibacillus sp. 481]UHA73252.1 ABC transporter permease [Paenibacillus sp. 481]